MLEFSPHPPLDSCRYVMRVLRTPTRGKLRLTVTSNTLLGTPTHWYTGRTLPCTGQDCEACQAGSSTRWHGYLAAYDPETQEHLLFEFTKKAALAFAAYRQRHNTLRGCEFLASRNAPKPNAQLVLRFKQSDIPDADLPQSPNLPAILCHLWGIPITECKINTTDNLAHEIEHTGPRIAAETFAAARTGQTPGGNNE